MHYSYWVKGPKYIHVLIAGSFREIKQFLFKIFGMQDLDETSFVSIIEINKDRFDGISGFSQKTYFSCSKTINTYNCSHDEALILKERCTSHLEEESKKYIPYLSVLELQCMKKSLLQLILLMQ